jgi:hypothetical protein
MGFALFRAQQLILNFTKERPFRKIYGRYMRYGLAGAEVQTGTAGGSGNVTQKKSAAPKNL